MPTLVVYISGHGFGHASRTIEVLRSLADRAPRLELHVRTSVAPWLFERTAPPGITRVAVQCDTGAVQLDSLELDVGATVAQAEAFMASFDERVAAEVGAITAAGATVVLADVPALGIAAGHAAGRPTVLLGNFTWDWIYEAYPGGSSLAARLGEIYARTDLALRLPLHGGFATCPAVRDLPFVARQSRRDPLDVRRALGLPLDRRLALVSFGGYGVNGLDLEALAQLAAYGIVMSGATPFRGGRLQDAASPGGLIALDEAGLYARGYRYEDVVRAVDVVVTKPGYGIIAECAANDTALLYTSRGAFAEYDVLVAGLPRLVRSAFIDQATLRAGHWGPALDALLAQPDPPERADVSGAATAADLLMDMM